MGICCCSLQLVISCTLCFLLAFNVVHNVYCGVAIFEPKAPAITSVYTYAPFVSAPMVAVMLSSDVIGFGFGT